MVHQVGAKGRPSALQEVPASANNAAQQQQLQGDASSWDELSQKMLQGRVVRPWVEFIAKDLFGRPRDLADVSARVQQNANYFAANYALVCLVVLSMTVLTSPSLIVAMICLGAVWLHASRTDDLEITQRYPTRRKYNSSPFLLKMRVYLLRAMHLDHSNKQAGSHLVPLSFAATSFAARKRWPRSAC